MGFRRNRACTARRGLSAWTASGEPKSTCCLRRSACNDDKLLRDAIVYLTCLHETGHALGLQHTDAFADIMYSFQYGGDIDGIFRTLPAQAAHA